MGCMEQMKVVELEWGVILGIVYLASSPYLDVHQTNDNKQKRNVQV